MLHQLKDVFRSLVDYQLARPINNKKLNHMNRPHAVIPVFSRLMTRTRSITDHARKRPESRFEDMRCIYAPWIPVFSGGTAVALSLIISRLRATPALESHSV